MPIGSGVGSGAAGFTPARNSGQASYQALNESRQSTTPDAHVTWALAQGDATMVSLTAPKLPAPVAAGVYAVTARFVPQSAPGAQWAVSLFLDNDFYSVIAYVSTLEETQLTATTTWYSDALSPMGVLLTCASVGPILFDGIMYVQRVT